MRSSRETTVLLARVAGSEGPAQEALPSTPTGRCIAMLCQAAELSGGRVMNKIGDEVMALFATPDAAAAAAARMHACVETLPIVPEKLGVRIGFHTGPVAQRDKDIFGDTVNLASQLAAEAMNGQILASEDAASRLAPVIRTLVRHMHSVQVKGKETRVSVGQLEWRQGADLAEPPSGAEPTKLVRARLHLSYGGVRVLRRREGDSVMIGRQADCELFICDPTASRRHCTIERRDNTFVLRDHSTNGTYVTVDGESEVRVHRQEYALQKRGWIAFGHSRARTSEVVQYFCE